MTTQQQTSAVPSAEELVTLTFRDWDHTRAVTMDVPWEVSVSEAVDEARRELDLPCDVQYQALYGDRQLGGLATLRDSGVKPDADVDLMPDVKAG